MFWPALLYVILFPLIIKIALHGFQIIWSFLLLHMTMQSDEYLYMNN